MWRGSRQAQLLRGPGLPVLQGLLQEICLLRSGKCYGKPFACNLSLFVKNNQDNFWHEWETYIFLQHLIEGLQNKYNFLTTNVNSAHEAEGYRYMTRIITPADVTIYCV